jgi:hypothetical protein
MSATSETQNELKVTLPEDRSFTKLAQSPTRSFGKVTIGIAGLPKYSASSHQDTAPFNNQPSQRKYGSDVICYGQEDNLTTICVHDGHGPQGLQASCKSLAYFKPKYKQLLTNLSETFTNLTSDEIYSHLQPLYQDTSDYLRKELPKDSSYTKGGTTCSHLSLVSHANRRYLISSNMGDTPILLINNQTGLVTRLYSEHNWENEGEYQCYVKQCVTRNVTPCVPMYGRWNCIGQPEIPDREGNYQPIPIYDVCDKQVTIHTDNLEHITQLTNGWGYIGGTQTCRKMVLQDEGSTVTEPYPGYAHTNWGSSIVTDIGGQQIGLCRCTRGWADWTEQHIAHTISDQPSLRVLELPEGDDITAVVMTDGIGDLWYFHRLGQFVQEKVRDCPTLTGSELAQLILLKTLQIANNKPEYSIKSGLPTWDNSSLVVARWASNDPTHHIETSDELSHQPSNILLPTPTSTSEEVPIDKGDITDETRAIVRQFVDDIIYQSLEKHYGNTAPIRNLQIDTDSVGDIDTNHDNEIFLEVSNSRPLTPPTMPNLSPDIYCRNHYLLTEYLACVDGAKILAQLLLDYYHNDYTQVWIPVSYSVVEVILARQILCNQQVFSNISRWKDQTHCLCFSLPLSTPPFKFTKLAELSCRNQLIPDHSTEEYQEPVKSFINHDTYSSDQFDSDTSDTISGSSESGTLIKETMIDDVVVVSRPTINTTYPKDCTICQGGGITPTSGDVCNRCDGCGVYDKYQHHYHKLYDYSVELESDSDNIPVSKIWMDESIRKPLAKTGRRLFLQALMDM